MVRKKKRISEILLFLFFISIGNYVNFGVFHLYSDPCFDNCLQVFISILTSIKKKDLLSYPKLTSSYFSLIETLALVKIDFLANLSIPLFGYVLETISEGFLSHEQTIQNSCCVYLDTFLSYVFRSVKKNNASSNLMTNVHEYESLFRQILVNLLNGIIYAECKYVEICIDLFLRGKTVDPVLVNREFLGPDPVNRELGPDLTGLQD